MARQPYTAEQLAFIEETYKKAPISTVTKQFNSKFGQNRSSSAIKSQASKHGFVCGRKPGHTKGEAPCLLNDAEIAFITERFKVLDINKLTQAFNAHFGRNLTKSQLRSQTKNRGIKSGRTGQFKPGQSSWNAGTKGICQANSGSFKKGQQPHNHVPVGTERVNEDGYVQVKVAEPREWKFKHRLVWEQEHGPLESGDVVLMIDGNKQNFAPSNLRKVENKHLGKLNRQYRFLQQPLEMRDTLIAITKLEIKAKEMTA